MRSRRLPPAHALADAPSRFVSLDGLRVHYKKVGDSGPALLFVPGWACDLTFWRYQAEALRTDARLLFVDLPGHGKSDRPQGIAYTHDLFVRALLAVLDDAAEPEVTVVGHSAGGSVARHLARREPRRLRALALVDPTLTAFYRDRAHLDELLALLRGPDPNRVALALIAPMVARHTPAMAALEIRMRMLLTPPHVRARVPRGDGRPGAVGGGRARVSGHGAPVRGRARLPTRRRPCCAGSRRGSRSAGSLPATS